ncbi:MAG: thiamine phosphate synthase [Rikenellaceae bacterium]
MNNINNYGLCMIITAPRLSYEQVARVAVECGVKYLQLREKGMDDRAILDAARRIKSVTDGTQTKFVINDRADLALLAGADMLHLGQGDITLADARKIVGDMAIGLSTHSLAQAREALAQQPEYIGFGPIYPTTTKAIADPTVGTELLSEVLSFADVPVIAIGGIFPENVAVVRGAGAKNICLVRHFMECESEEELRNRVKALL